MNMKRRMFTSILSSKDLSFAREVSPNQLEGSLHKGKTSSLQNFLYPHKHTDTHTNTYIHTFEYPIVAVDKPQI